MSKIDRVSNLVRYQEYKFQIINFMNCEVASLEKKQDQKSLEKLS